MNVPPHRWIVCALVVASCAFDWDTFDPRLGEGTTGQAGASAGASGGSSMGGAPPECANDGAPCGNSTDSDCDLADSCLGGSCVPNIARDGAACDDCASAFCQCGSGQCEDCNVEIDLATQLTTGLGQDGFMFDLVATSPVRIRGFDTHLNVGRYEIAIYYRVGGYSGFDMDMAAWTLVGTASGVMSNGLNMNTPIPIAIDLVIAAGDTVGWYITSTVTSGVDQVMYSNGTLEGAVQTSDEHIQILEGIAKKYPFADLFTPRAWNGIVHYTACE